LSQNNKTIRNETIQPILRFLDCKLESATSWNTICLTYDVCNFNYQVLHQRKYFTCHHATYQVQNLRSEKSYRFQFFDHFLLLTELKTWKNDNFLTVPNKTVAKIDYRFKFADQLAQLLDKFLTSMHGTWFWIPKICSSCFNCEKLSNAKVKKHTILPGQGKGGKIPLLPSHADAHEST